MYIRGCDNCIKCDNNVDLNYMCLVAILVLHCDVMMVCVVAIGTSCVN